jgi:hypothetical protein
VGLLRREGAQGRAPLYRATAKLLEITGAASLAELRGRVMAGVPSADAQALVVNR